ncbi:MAG: hypothetical protein M1436_03080 [Acidobacteria bacterium]|nr:hypothetical protein [Acidobacteriota bacterium]
MVSHAAAGELDLLRERVIGIEVFDRDPSYDKNEDSVVRVRANDVRRRLVQYYAEHAAPDEPRIVIHAGSYAPEFLFPTGEEQAATAVEPRPRTLRSRWLWALALAAIVLTVIGTYLYFLRQISPARTVERFWKPLCEGRTPVIVAVSEPLLFGIPSRWRDLKSERGDEADVRLEVFRPDVRPDETVSAAEIQSFKGLYVGAAVASAAVSAKGALTRQDTPTMFRLASQIEMDDLRARPTVLIGGYANPWVLRFTKDLRFYLDRDGWRRCVRDRQNQAARYEVKTAPDGEPIIDYPVLSRLVHSETGRPMIIASAMTQWGCASAIELATQPADLIAVLSRVPGWQQRNLQILTRIKIIRRSPTAPEVVAVQAW